MPNIRIVLICMSVLAACTTEPDNRPDLSPPGVCQEACEQAADCGDGAVCCTNPEECGADHRCVSCTADKQCPDGACVAGACVECADDADCKGNEKGSRCTATNTCAKCNLDVQCKGDPAGGRCTPAGTCTCNGDKDCKEPGLSLCRAEGCVCTDDSGCTAGAEKCDVASGVCIACDKDSQCAEGKTKCIAGDTPAASCGCASDDECGGEGEAPFCAKDNGACVVCLTDAQCGKGGKCFSPGTPAANCGCTKNADCDGAVCNKATGACQQCVEGPDCEKLELGSICTEEGTCACDSASECGAKNTTAKLEWVCE